jgi:hypothetical protein
MTNEQRIYFGLEIIEDNWEKIILKGDKYRSDSLLYFDGEILKKQIISNENQYLEFQYNEPTKERSLLLPKTNKGKEQKLSISNLEKRNPIGVNVNITSRGLIQIKNSTTETTFYSSDNEKLLFDYDEDIENIISAFIKDCPMNFLEQLNKFKHATRKNIKYKDGDIFSFRISPTHFGYGRILLDITKIRKQNLLNDHSFNLFFGRPVLVQLYAFASTEKNISISKLENISTLPSDYIQENAFVYGEFEIIGNKEIEETDFEFPISYSESYLSSNVILQWGVIQKILPLSKFNKYTIIENPNKEEYSEYIENPHSYLTAGAKPRYFGIEIMESIKNNGVFDYKFSDLYSDVYKLKYDLRNPSNDNIRRELFQVFGLNPDKSYIENCELTGTESTKSLMSRLKK